MNAVTDVGTAAIGRTIVVAPAMRIPGCFGPSIGDLR
jgi:hypothetical protein